MLEQKYCKLCSKKTSFVGSAKELLESNDKEYCSCYSKNSITFEEHKEFGKLCKIFNKKLILDSIRISKEQKTKALGKEKTFRYSKSQKALSELRENLEEIMFEDYPEKATTKIYYGIIEEEETK